MRVCVPKQVIDFYESPCTLPAAQESMLTTMKCADYFVNEDPTIISAFLQDLLETTATLFYSERPQLRTNLAEDFMKANRL